MNRRDFLKTSALAAAAVAAAPLTTESAPEPSAGKPSVKSYREIGKTGLKMSDISFGAGRLASPSMILRAVDSGINYFDTAPDYGASEKLIGEAMSKIKRDKIIITTKFCNHTPYPGHLPLGSKKREYVASVDDSLARLKTDYVDFIFVHAVGGERGRNKELEDEKKRLLDDEMLSAVDTLKKAGKVKFLGVSSHGPANLESLLMTAVKSGHFDLIMPSFNFMNFPKLPEVMKEAHKRKVGVVAMKTLAGAKDTNIEAKNEEFAHAAFKWVLKHPEVSGLVVTMKTVSDIETYLAASGKKFTQSDRKALNEYAMMFGREYCRTGCNECESLCNRGVEIANIMRYQMYFKDYGMEKRAIESYTSVRSNSAACGDCDNPVCVSGCPYGLSVKNMLADAHEMLTLSV
ncbi:MAG: twin-arginine translocation signal domain-containing protein [Nitrospirae bacterium]|nr:MAG: twin-arginine translocation signal domain-containing protein [Nitrospirota bacterium]